MLPVVEAQAATPLRCGATITSNVVLAQDLTCTGDGLRVGANGLTIDLNGHQLKGSGTGTGINAETVSPSTPELRNFSVRNGTISRFGVGLSRHNFAGTASVSRVVFSKNGAGIGATSSNDSVALVVSDSTFASNNVGLDQFREKFSNVSRSTFRGNGTGASLRDTDAALTSNSFIDNAIGLQASSTGVQIRANLFIGGTAGVDIADAMYGVTVERNSFTGTGLGVETRNGGNVVGNIFISNGSAGLYMHGLGGTATGNTFARNGFRPASRIDPTGKALTAGLWADAGKTITGNTAYGNAGYGIEGHGVVDGGKNRAALNGNPAQCVGVVCAR
jgi:hypothetical protein